MPAILQGWIVPPVVEPTGSHGDADTRLRQRDSPMAHMSSSTGIIVIAAILAGIVGSVIFFVALRLIRRRHPNPKYLPTPFLKRVWFDWRIPRSGAYEQTSSDEDSQHQRSGGSGGGRMRELRQNGAAGDRTSQASSSPNTAAAAAATAGANTTSGGGGNDEASGGVDRNTSVRSVATLPAYRLSAAETEQVLGREGERDGIDVVVELPTAEEEEALRDDEMEAMYQIRAARRRQLAEREARRAERQAARTRHDALALTALRDRTRAASTQDVAEIEGLRRTHERIKDTRQRAVSSVSYADVGVARADGTRIRANSAASEASERVGLLSDAASITAPSIAATIGTRHARSPSATSTMTAGSSLLLQHRRDGSAGAMSIDTVRSNNSRLDAPGSGGLSRGGSITSQSGATSLRGRRARAGSSASGTRSRAGSGAATPRAGSSPEMVEADEGDEGSSESPELLPPPPGYDDVSLDDLRISQSRSRERGLSVGRDSPSAMSGRESPYDEPPPDYPGPARARSNRLSAHVESLVAAAANGAGPSIGGVPQIVIQPESVRQR